MTSPISPYFLVLFAVSVAACSQEQPDQPPAEPPVVANDPLIENCGTVSDGGFCGVRIGMTLAQAKAAFPLALESFSGDQEPSCFMVFPEGRSGDLTFMLVDGKVARVDVFMPGIAADNGSQVGTLEEDILHAYGYRAKVFPNKYDDRKHDIVVDTRFHYQMIFETDGSKVLSYRAGVLPPVGYVEGCS